MCAITGVAQGDGGQVIATGSIGKGSVVMMVNPSQPTVGMIAVIVRVSPALEPAQCTLRARSAMDSTPIECAMSADPDGLGQRALIQCADASLWTISVRVATALGEMNLQAELQVAPEPPKWQSLSPWILSWIPLAALLLLGQVARRCSPKKTDTNT